MNHDFERRRVLKSSGEVLGSYCQRCGHLVQLEGGATYNRLVVDWIANE